MVQRVCVYIFFSINSIMFNEVALFILFIYFFFCIWPAMCGRVFLFVSALRVDGKAAVTISAAALSINYLLVILFVDCN